MERGRKEKRDALTFLFGGVVGAFERGSFLGGFMGRLRRIFR